MTLQILLSSVFFFCAKGGLENAALGAFWPIGAVLKNLSEMVADEDSDAQSEHKRLSEVVPKFIWLMRDF
jgi:hypothetical protein